MELAAAAIRDGAIVAVKGLGGFHLMAAAGHNAAVMGLRQRKQREEKPFASCSLPWSQCEARCELSELEQELLCSTRRSDCSAQTQIVTPIRAPAVSRLGWRRPTPTWASCLPYTPLHHLLLS